MSQAEIEARFFDRVERIRKGEQTPDQAFAEESEWLLELGERRFLLHPGMVRWLAYDRLHDDWYDTGYGPGEAILVAEGRQAGAMRLPELAQPGEPATVAGWCLVADGARWLGVRRAEEVRRAQAEGWLSAEARVFDAASGQWHAIEAFAGPAGSPPAGIVPPEWPVSRAAEPVVASRAAKPVVAGRAAEPSVPPPGPATPPEPVPAPARRPAFCGHCGARLGPPARFCSSCGQPVG